MLSGSKALSNSRILLLADAPAFVFCADVFSRNHTQVEQVTLADFNVALHQQCTLFLTIVVVAVILLVLL
jgi:hypothetical protein